MHLSELEEHLFKAQVSHTSGGASPDSMTYVGTIRLAFVSIYSKECFFLVSWDFVDLIDLLDLSFEIIFTCEPMQNAHFQSLKGRTVPQLEKYDFGTPEDYLPFL